MTGQANETTFLCISSFFKGEDFLVSCKNLGNKVLLITSKGLEHKKWPRESIDEIFYMQEQREGVWNMDDLISGLAFLMRNQKIDRIVALDDFDVEKATLVREHFRIPGMGQTTGRYFRDKLAMRMKAAEADIPVPAFTPLFNNSEIEEYTKSVQAPWLIKPRSEASATGIRKIFSIEELWPVLESLGDRRHEYLLEKFAPGDVYHVDSLSVDGKIVFTQASQYLSTPMDVAHGHGIFRSVTLKMDSPDAIGLMDINAEVLKAFGMRFSASHSEYIKSRETGKFYFLETASRVGGAHLAEMVFFATGVNLWKEWAIIEDAMAKGKNYKLPKVKNEFAGIVVSLCRFQHPDSSCFTDEEICWQLQKDYHIGHIVKSEYQERVLELLDSHTKRIQIDFHASS